MTTPEIIAVSVLLALWALSFWFDYRLKKAYQKSEEQSKAMQVELNRLQKNLDIITEHLQLVFPLQHANRN
ncbi:hypothetical protein [Spirosoma flavum]|uniref:LapA family protein n=1 Tax=Spirosoma flavum TaxID=2048557 RepID=A0ABW6APX1_9BACT